MHASFKKCTVVAVDENKGTAEALYVHRSLIRSDFIVLSCDIICDTPLHQLVDLHRTQRCCATVLLKAPEVKADAPVDLKAREKALKTACFVGLTGQNRVVYIANAEDCRNHGVIVPKPLLKRAPAFEIHSDYDDAHCYIFSRWVLDIMGKESNITSVKDHLIPLLVKLQFKIDERDLPDGVLAKAKDADQLAEAFSLSASAAGRKVMSEPIRVYAHILTSGLCVRVNEISKYYSTNKDMISYTPATSAVWAKAVVSTNRSYRNTLEGVDVLCTGENVSVQTSIIGQHCRIGTGTKINGCVIMDNVTIESGCTIQNCVISKECIISENCKLSKVNIGKGVTVHKGEVLEDENLVKDI